MNANSAAENSFEVERLKTVYQTYSERNFGSSKWSSDNRGNQAILQEREKVLADLFFNSGFLPLADKRILDVGCGMGGVLTGFEGLGARPDNLFGVDLLAERIAKAKELFPRFSFQPANAEALPFPDSSFDLVALFTVFSSILSVEMTRNVAREVIRVLKPNGAIVWYDFRFNNPSNRNVLGVSARKIRSLFPGFLCRLRTVTLLPPLARRLGAFTRRLYSPLVAVPFLRSHYLGILRKA
jgi:SAM-dependent methyltransferase